MIVRPFILKGQTVSILREHKAAICPFLSTSCQLHYNHICPKLGTMDPLAKLEMIVKGEKLNRKRKNAKERRISITPCTFKAWIRILLFVTLRRKIYQNTF
jgi:hypothetical protein